MVTVSSCLMVLHVTEWKVLLGWFWVVWYRLLSVGVLGVGVAPFSWNV